MRVLPILILLVAICTPLRAQIFLTGGLMYDANSVGLNINGGWEFDTFSTPDTGNAKFDINGLTDIAIPLSPGANTVSLSGGSFGSYSGLGLFFSSSATPMAGPFGAVPNLVVVDSVAASTTFSFATGGSMVATYGQLSGDVSYSGATTYQVGGYEVTVTAFDFGGGANNLQFNVTAIPEPVVSALMGGLAALGLAASRGRVQFLRWRRP